MQYKIKLDWAPRGELDLMVECNYVNLVENFNFRTQYQHPVCSICPNEKWTYTKKQLVTCGSVLTYQFLDVSIRGSVEDEAKMWKNKVMHLSAAFTWQPRSLFLSVMFCHPEHCILYIILCNFLLTVPTYQTRVDICKETNETVQERNGCVSRNWH